LYLLFEALQKKLPEVECWNIITPRVWNVGKRYYGPHWPNPRGLRNVHTFVLNGAKGRRTIQRVLRHKPVAAIISKSRATTVLLKRLAPTTPVWHLTSTCSLVKNAVARGDFPSMEHVIRRLRTSRFPELRSTEEQQAVRLADRILCHSRNMQFWYHTFYPYARHKMEDAIFWDYPQIRHQFHGIPRRTAWEKRPIDLLFVASDWRRGEKNFPLLRQLCKAFAHKKIMVIGFVPERLPASVIAFDTMSQDDVVQAMIQAKVVVCPSRYDEAPNVLFEAAVAGANIVCSRNCGNYQVTDTDLIARLELRDFARKVRTALQRYRAPHTERFSGHDLCEWIIGQLAPKHE